MRGWAEIDLLVGGTTWYAVRCFSRCIGDWTIALVRHSFPLRLQEVVPETEQKYARTS